MTLVSKENTKPAISVIIPVFNEEEILRKNARYFKNLRKDKISIFPDRVNTSPRRWEKEGALFCTLRNWVLSGLYFIGVDPKKSKIFFKQGNDAYN